MEKIEVTKEQQLVLGAKLEHLCTMAAVVSSLEDANFKTPEMNKILDLATAMCDELNRSIGDMFEVKKQ